MLSKIFRYFESAPSLEGAKPQPNYKIFVNLFAVVCICVLLAAGIIAFSPSHTVTAGEFNGFNFYHMQGRSLCLGRRTGFIVLCLLCAVLGWVFSRTVASSVLRGESKVAKYFLCCVFAALVATEVFFRQNFLPFVFVGALLSFMMWRHIRYLRHPAMFYLAIVGCSFGIGELLYALLFVQPDFCKFEKWPDAITSIDAHQAFIFTGPVDRLTSGFKLGVDTCSPYGLFWQFIFAYVQKLTGVLSFGAVITLTGALQLIFLCGAGLAYFKHAKRSRSIACLAFLSLIPWFITFDNQTHYPNVSVLRLSGFLFAVVHLFWIAPKLADKKLWLVTGITAGLCLLMNFETGICITFALFLFLVSQRMWIFSPNLKLAIAILIVFFAGVFCAFSVFELAVALGFGYFISISGWIESFKTMLSLGLSGGTSTGVHSAYSLPFIAACHCGYLLVRLSGDSQPFLKAGQATSLAIAAMCLLWSGYYMNAPVPDAFAATYFLYLLLVIDLLRAFCLQKIRPEWFQTALICSLFVIASETLVEWSLFQDKVKTLLSCRDTVPKDSLTVSGIRFPKGIADELNMRAAFLKKEAALSANGRLAYLTNSYTLLFKASGVVYDIPFNDVFISTMRYKDSIKLVDYLVKNRVKNVYVDPPNLVMHGNAHQESCMDFFRLLLKKHYNIDRTTDGWQVWTLIE